jgi:ABC-type Zn uptake system ZnuABC Zn-binding protein ZnuA
LKRQLAQIKTRIRDAGFKVSTAAHHHLTEQIDQLDQLWVKLSPALRQRELISNHPAYQYVSRRYQLKITPFDLSPDEAPSSSQVNELHRHILHQRSQQVSRGRHAPPIMLWESTPSTSTLDALKSLKLTHVVLNTLEQPPITTKDAHSDAPNPLQIYAEQLHHLTSALEISVESNTTSH